MKKTLTILFSLFFKILIGSIVIFFIPYFIPVDPIETTLNHQGLSKDKNENYQYEYEKLYISENRNLPLFYFSIIPSHHHKNINSIVPPNKRERIMQLQHAGFDCSKLNNNPSDSDLNNLSKSEFFYPRFILNGFNNQYHLYFKNLIKGQWGTSKKDGEQVFTKINHALCWTLCIVLLSLFISILISLLLSFWLIDQNEKVLSKVDSFFLFLFSVPTFWLATIVLIFFNSPEYGVQLFYSPLYTEVEEGNFISVLTKGFSKIAPVIFCISLLDTAYLSRMFIANLKDEINKPYVDVLRTRGLSFSHIKLKHLFPNTLIPIVTLIIGSLPLAFAGTLIYEVVFNIAGMGRLLYDSIITADWKLVYTIIFIIFILTVLLYSIGDLIYKKIDPGIKDI